MLGTLDALTATIGVVFVLSLIVQAVQQILKQLFSFKSAYMRRELLAMLGVSGPWWLTAPLAEGYFRACNRKDGGLVFVRKLSEKLAGLGYDDLSLLERMNAQQFMVLARDVARDLWPGAPAPVKKTLRNLERDVARYYDVTLQAFQDHYERRMKLWAYVISFVLVSLLNVNVFKVYQEFAADEELREAAVQSTQRMMASYEARRAAGAGGAETPSGPSWAAIDTQLKRIDTLFSSRGFQLMRWDTPGRDTLTIGPDSVSTATYFFRGVRKNFWGILLMTFLVGLGAPFWYDILKTIMGLKQRAAGAPAAEEPSKGARAKTATGPDPVRAARTQQLDDNAESEQRVLQAALKLPPPDVDVSHGRIR